MPELPEVHTVIEDLRLAGLPGRQILSATASWPRTVGGDPLTFARRIRNGRITSLDRRGKYIVIALERCDAALDDCDTALTRWNPGGFLLIHLRMSGRLYLTPPTEELTGYERVVLYLDDKRELRFYDPRKFGRFIFTEQPGEILDTLGVEPLSAQFTVPGLSAILKGTRRRIKALLLDQRQIAGLGNIYADEALWLAGVHPERRSYTLTTVETRRLHDAIGAVLLRGIKNLGTSLGSGKSNFQLPSSHGDSRARNQEELAVFQQTGKPCPRCGTPIERIIVAQRSTHLCPQCQTPDRISPQ